MTDRKRRPGRKNAETSPSRHTSGIPTTETTPKEDLSGTIQDPDARSPTTAPGGNLPGPDLPRTEEGELDFSSIGRSEFRGRAEAHGRGRGRCEAGASQGDDGGEEELGEDAEGGGGEEGDSWEDVGRGERGARERPPRVRVRGVEGGTLLSNLSERSSGCERGEKDEGEKKLDGGGVDDYEDDLYGASPVRPSPPNEDEDDLYGASPVRPSPPNILPAKQGDEQEKEQGKEKERQPDNEAEDEDDLYGASPVRPGPPNILPAKQGDEQEKEQGKEKERQPDNEAEDEDDLYGASPVRPGPPKVLQAKKEDTGEKKKEQEKRPEDKKSGVAFGKPKSPKVSSVKEQGSLWSRFFSRAQKSSPTKSEKYRRLAANETTELTEKEKFDYWMKDELSSPRAFVADEKEWQKEMELLYAREKHIAQLQQAKADASVMISQGDKEHRERQQLEEMINQCDLHLQEAEELEDKRQRRRSLQASLDLETSPNFIAKFNDQLRDLNGKIEDGEKKEKMRLKPWVDVSPDWSARLQKAADMTPSERAASSTGRGLHAPARPPGQLKQSPAERALRLQWAAEDSPHEDELLEIQTYSDKTERDVAWELAMRKRQSVLLARHKILSDLWTKQAEEMRADRESAWLESKGEKRIPSSGPQSRVASIKQSKALREGTGESGAGQPDILSDKQKREKKDEEDKKKEVVRKEVEGSKKISGTESEDAGRLGERHRLGKRGIFNTSGLRQMPEMEAGSSPMRKKSLDVISKPSEKAAPESRNSTTPEKALSPFRAIKSISPLQAGRKKPEFHADSEVSESVEMVDLDMMRKLVDAVAKPIWIGVEGAAENVAAMERRATRIREAKERLALAAKEEVEKKKKEQGEKEGGEEEKLSFKEMMKKLKRERAERQEKEQKRQMLELERRKKEEEDMAVEREEKKERQEKEKKDERKKREAYIWTEREISTKKDELKRQERENEEIIESEEREERERKAKAENEVKERTERAKRKLKEDYEREMKELRDSKRDDQARRDRKEQYEKEAEERSKRQREENEQRKIKEAEVKARREREQQARRELIRNAKKRYAGRERREKEAEERENAERQRLIDDEFDSDDEEQYGPIEQHFLKYFIRVLSWFKRRDPESTETESSVNSRGSLYSVLESPDNSLDSKTTSFGNPPPETIDPNSPPDSPSWLRDHGPDLPTLDYIHLHLTIFSSPDQRHPNPSTPIYYATYSNVPLWWNVSQLKRFLGRGSVRSEALHGRVETFPSCVGWVKEDGKAIEEGDAEEKKMRLRVAGRQLKSGGRDIEG
ncbi:hypothetical protein DID88_002081 [Monilinia fructigena]|uniref:Uncharacterized protein n=1 Tax=Monilinia fructigena TaxID=38457 RepID=A0A395IWT9_9HELO|nr:hypothetical protein DID88_002081 [Monilinia fructigena]